MTGNDIRRIAEEALQASLMKIDESEEFIPQALDRAWNRGANVMFNEFIIHLCEFERSEKE